MRRKRKTLYYGHPGSPLIELEHYSLLSHNHMSLLQIATVLTLLCRLDHTFCRAKKSRTGEWQEFHKFSRPIILSRDSFPLFQHVLDSDNSFKISNQRPRTDSKSTKQRVTTSFRGILLEIKWHPQTLPFSRTSPTSASSVIFAAEQSGAMEYTLDAL